MDQVSTQNPALTEEEEDEDDSENAEAGKISFFFFSLEVNPRFWSQ